jgi:hypothetical protein
VDDVTHDGTIMGSLRWTGLRPTFVPKLERRGVKLPDALTVPGHGHDVTDLAKRIGAR